MSRLAPSTSLSSRRGAGAPLRRAQRRSGARAAEGFGKSAAKEKENAKANKPVSEWGEGRVAGAEERPKEESRGSGESKLSLVLREPREIERGVAEQLVEMFRKQPKTEWSKLVGYSAEWTEISESFFEYVSAMIRETADPGEEAALLAMRRRLRRIDVTLRDALDLVAFARDARREGELQAWVAQRRAELTPDTFSYLQALTSRVEDEAEQDELATLMTELLALCQAHDNLGEQEESLMDAGAKLESILQEGQSLQQMVEKIDTMGDSGEIDAAFMLTMAKAHAAAKESSMVRDEAKDVMAHLYFRAKENLAKNLPAEVRILRHLMSIEDPQELRANLEDAFKGGDTLDEWTSGVPGGKDYLSTTPSRLLDCCDAVLGAYMSQRTGTMLSQAIPLMNPESIDRVRAIHALIMKEFAA